MNRYITFVFAVSVMFLSGCTALSEKGYVKSLTDLSSDEVMIVGRIEIDPPFKDEDFKIQNGGKLWLNKIQVFLGDQLIEDVANTGTIARFKHAFMVPLGEEFYVKVKRSDPIFLSGGFVQLELRREFLGGNVYRWVDKKLIVPGGVTLDTSGTEEAIYIGTIRYTRDEYDAVTAVKVIDDRKRVNSDLNKKFNTKMKLEKVGLKPVN